MPVLTDYSAALAVNVVPDTLSPNVPTAGAITAAQEVGASVEGRTRLTFNWTAPTRTATIAGELLGQIANGAAVQNLALNHDPISADTFAVTALSAVTNYFSTLAVGTPRGASSITAAPTGFVPIVGDWISVGTGDTQEFFKVGAVNGLVYSLESGKRLAFSHEAGEQLIQALTASAKVSPTDYTVNTTTGAVLTVANRFATGDHAVATYQTPLDDLSHYTLTRTAAAVSDPTYENVEAAAGFEVVADPIASGLATYNYLLPAADNGKTFYYFLFAVDTETGTANESVGLAMEINTIPGVPQGLTLTGTAGRIVVSWNQFATTGGANANIDGFNIYRAGGVMVDYSTAVRLNSTRIHRASLAFDDGPGNDHNRVSEVTAAFPISGQEYTYWLEAEDSETSWIVGTANGTAGVSEVLTASK